MRRKIILALTTVMLISLLGCSQSCPPGERAKGSTLNICGSDIEPILEVAKNVVEQDYQIATVNPKNGLIQTIPTEYRGSERKPTLDNVVVPANKTFRRIVTVKISRISEQIISISVRANVERLDTHYMQNYARMRQSDDTPSQLYQNNAIEVDREKREVWTPNGRDLEVEREILNAIKDLLPQTN